MNKDKYQRKINDIITKCPIEAGTEILVYNFLDELIDEKQYSLVDINRIWKNQDSRLITDAGIPDIAILSNDFLYKDEERGSVYGFVEVKAPGVSLRETDQFIGESKSISNYIYTNGLIWKYYKDGSLDTEINLIDGRQIPHSISSVNIDDKKFMLLKNTISNIQWIVLETSDSNYGR